MLKGMLREREEEPFSSKRRRKGWLEGTTETQAELDLRLRDSARSEPGLLREEPGLEARGGMRLGGRGLWQSWCWSRGQNQGPQLFDLVSCSPGQQLEAREKGGVDSRASSRRRLGGNLQGDVPLVSGEE